MSVSCASIVGGSVAGGAHHQRGVALAVALVVLLILTILGISALVSTALEGLMAGNVQEKNRAHQAAETGIDVALARADAYVAVFGQEVTGGDTVFNASYRYRNTYQGLTDPPPSGKPNSKTGKIKVHRFRTVSDGTANSGATVTLTQGMYQTGPAPTE